jgi:protein-disulfide isomerase
VRYKIPVSASQPGRGPADALVTIIEWCDLYGEACRRSDTIVQAVLEAHPHELRRVFRHVAGASEAEEHAHELARIAHEQAGKFWEVRAAFAARDAAPDRAELERVATAVGLDWAAVAPALDKGRFANHVLADRVFAKMFRVHSTPALFVNGRRLEGELSRERLEALVGEELATARSLVERGIARADVYASVTADAVWDSPIASAGR